MICSQYIINGPFLKIEMYINTTAYRFGVTRTIITDDKYPLENALPKVTVTTITNSHYYFYV